MRFFPSLVFFLAMALLDTRRLKSEIGLADLMKYFKINRNVMLVQSVLQQLVLINGNYQKTMRRN